MKKNWFIVTSGVIVGFVLLGWTFKPTSLKRMFNNNGSPKQVNVLLIVLDAQRKDHLSCYGYSRKTSPNIDEIAGRGLVFENAFAPLPMTQPSFASMFTSLYPQSHGIKRNDLALSPKAVTLAETLHAHGWNTAAVIGASNLDSVFGFNQGFELYEDSMGRKLDPEIKAVEHMKRWERKAEEVNRIAFRWLDHRKSNSPFFLFLHYYDPHKPYAPPPPFDRKYDPGSDEKSKIRALYDGEVSYLDQQLGLLFRKLENMNRMQNTLLLITADHGEGLGDHNWQGHIWKIYDEAVRVPLIIAGPGIRKGKHVSQLVENVDYMPSILEYLNIERQSPFQGVSFWPAVENSQATRNYVLLEKAKPPWNLPQLNPEWQKFPYAQWAIRTKTEKFIWSSDKKHEYYDLVHDPGELHNLFSTERQQALSLFRKGVEYRSHFGRLALGVPPVRTIEGNDPDEVLRALGYIN